MRRDQEASQIGVRQAIVELLGPAGRAVRVDRPPVDECRTMLIWGCARQVLLWPVTSDFSHGREGGRHAGGTAIATRRAAHSSRETSRTARDGRRGTDTASTQPIHLLTASPDQQHRDEPPETRGGRSHRNADQRNNQAHRSRDSRVELTPGRWADCLPKSRRERRGSGHRATPSARILQLSPSSRGERETVEISGIAGNYLILTSSLLTREGDTKRSPSFSYSRWSFHMSCTRSTIPPAASCRHSCSSRGRRAARPGRSWSVRSRERWAR